MISLIRHGEPMMPSPEKLADLQERLAIRLFIDAEGKDGLLEQTERKVSDWAELHPDDKAPYLAYAASALNWMRETVQLAMEGKELGN